MSHPALQSLPQGWLHHGEQILALVEAHRPAVVVELGTHLGASAIAMARVLRAWGGVIYCVDTWSGRVKDGSGLHPFKLQACGHNLRAAGVSGAVRLIVAPTGDAADAWTGPPIDCLYVDADHSYEGCLADLTDWTPHVRPGGLLMGDDYDNPKCPGVAEAWSDFERQHGLTFTRTSTAGTQPPSMSLIHGIWRPQSPDWVIENIRRDIEADQK